MRNAAPQGLSFPVYPARLLAGLVGAVMVAFAAPVTAQTPGGSPTPDPSSCNDLALTIDWNGQAQAWEVNGPSPAVACQGKNVTWTIGTTPDATKRYFAWIHIDPYYFQGMDDVGFGVVESAAAGQPGQPLTVQVRDRGDTTADALRYAVLCLSPASLSSTGAPGDPLQDLAGELAARDYAELRAFQRLTFAQQDSPPKMIVR